MAEETKQLSTTQKQLVTVHANLEKLLQAKRDALPKNFNQTRFLQNCMTVLQDTRDIHKMQPMSIARTMLKGAFLGLDFFNKECYAIPYGNALNFQTDYKGEIKLAKKYSLKKIQDIYAKLVREGDEFEEAVVQGKQVVNFKPKKLNNGKILGVFAVCLYVDGSMLYESMSIEEVEKVRHTYSKQANGKAWKDSHGEMVKKTALRRLCKMIELDFENAEQDEAFQDGGDAEFVDVTEIYTDEPTAEDLENKLMGGNGNGEFKPATPVQIATIAKHAKKASELDEHTQSELSDFLNLSDEDKTFDSAKSWIEFFENRS